MLPAVAAAVVNFKLGANFDICVVDVMVVVSLGVSVMCCWLFIWVLLLGDSVVCGVLLFDTIEYCVLPCELVEYGELL